MHQQCLVQITHVQYTQHNGYVLAPRDKINIVDKYMYIEKTLATPSQICANIAEIDVHVSWRVKSVLIL